MNKPQSRTVPALLSEITGRNSAHWALLDGARQWSYHAFGEDVERCARALLASGIRPGDRVGILAGNRAEWLIADFAIMSIGAIAVGLNTWATARELAYQLTHSAVKVLFVEPRFRARDFIQLVAEARVLGDGCEALALVVAFDVHAGCLHYPEFLARAGSISSAELAQAIARVLPEDVACLLYTSGSTALPKGVPLRHRGLLENMWEIGERQHLHADDRLWLAVSLFWSLACVNAVFAVMTHGGTIVLQHHFEAGEALRLIEAERCTVFYGTPNMALALPNIRIAPRAISRHCGPVSPSARRHRCSGSPNSGQRRSAMSTGSPKPTAIPPSPMPRSHLLLASKQSVVRLRAIPSAS